MNASKVNHQAEQHWSKVKESGTLRGMQLLYWTYKLFGRWIFSLAMYPVAIYFALCKSEYRRASLQYLHFHYHAHPCSWSSKPNLISVILHFKAFAEVILDKLLGWLIEIKECDFVLNDRNEVERLLNDERGQLIIGSHFGNLEFCRGFMHRYKSKVINVLLYDKHAGNFVKIMQQLSSDSRMNIYQVDEFDINIMLTLKEKIDAGEWVFIAGDRVPLSGLERTVAVDFLGRKAALPIGPYMLAKALGCPVKLMFAYKKASNNNKIIFDVSTLSERVTLSRKNKMDDIQKLAQIFVNELEKQSIAAPYQWFNFYNFWQRRDQELPNSSTS